MEKELTATAPRIYYGYWVLLTMFLGQVMLNGTTGYAFGLFVVPLENEFHWSRASIMTANLLLSVFAGIASPFIGRIMYRRRAKKVIAAGAVLMAVGLALLGLTQTLWHFYLLFSLIGLSSTAVGVLPASMILSNWFKRQRGFAIGILGMGIGAGGFTVPWLLSAYIIPEFGWRFGYITCGVLLAAVIIPLSLLVIRETPEEIGLLPDNNKKGGRERHRPLPINEADIPFERVIKTPAFWLMAVSFTAFSFGNGHTFFNQVPHLQDIGYPAVEAAIAVQAVGIGSAIGKFGFGWLCDYIRPHYILIVGSVLELGATLLLMQFDQSSTLCMLWVYGLIMGLGMGSWLPAISMTTSATFGLMTYGVVFGIYNMLFNIGNALGPVVGGYIFDSTGTYGPAFILCLIAYAIAVGTMFLTRPRHKQPVLHPS